MREDISIRAWMARSHVTSALASRPGLSVTLFVVALTATLMIVMPLPLSPDISGQLWIADRLRQGARLYVDISEINPPLWFWLAMPVDCVSDFLGIRAEYILILAVGCATLLALLATDRLLADYAPAMRVALLMYAACIVLVMPVRDLGQREQLALIGAVPYIALIAARREGRRVPSWLALSVGTGAAAGFALKHYFIAVPLSLELWLFVCLSRAWRPFRPETLLLLAGALAYGIAILIVTPAYLQISVPELVLAYGQAGAPSLRYMIRPAQPIWVLILYGIVIHWTGARRPAPPVPTALLVAAGGFFLAWLIQHKGWPYQSIATTGALSLTLATTLAERMRNDTAPPRIIVVVALILPVLLFVVPTQWVPTRKTDIAPALVGLHRGDVVAIVSKEGRSAWPSTVDSGFRFAGRRGSFWIFGAVDADAMGVHDPRIADLGRKVVRQTVLDYHCLPPKRIIFAPGRAPAGDTSASDNPLGFFLRDPEFVAILAHYRRLDVPSDVDAFDLKVPMKASAGARCPRGV